MKFHKLNLQQRLTDPCDPDDASYEISNFKRPFKMIHYDTYIDYDYTKESFLRPTILLNPEAMAFLFLLEGCPKNLFIFLILVKLNRKKDNIYNFNSKVIDQFIEFSNQCFQTKYTIETVKQAHRKLVESNVTCNVKKGLYNFNPLICGGSSDAKLRELLLKHSEFLMENEAKDALTDLYP